MAELSYITVSVPAGLKEVVIEAAESSGETLAKFVTRALAIFVERPEFSKQKRRGAGRPKKTVVAAKQKQPSGASV